MATPLPIDALLPEFDAAISAGHSVVLEAAPGAGKTTRVPPALLKHFCRGRIVVLEPRRLAARASATRVAAELGEKVGERVGYKVRFERAVGPQTRIEYVTEGVFLRELIAKPELDDVAAVVLDEFHERHSTSDIVLAWIRRCRIRRPSLGLVVMSATFDGKRVAETIGAKHLYSEGRSFPVEITHRDKPDARPLEAQVRAALVPHDGNSLVFLPGVGEIERCRRALDGRDEEVLTLHGELPREQQDAVFARSSRPRIILATPIAETSLTLPGVTRVVDSGLARKAEVHPFTGLSSIEVRPISRASARQRAGRAGRTAPGSCHRLYSKSDFLARPEHDLPELLCGDGLELTLLLARLLVPLDELPLLDQPDAGTLERAGELLDRLGLLAGGTLTPLGRDALDLPLHPRLAKFFLEAKSLGCPRRGAIAAALLSERDVLDRRVASTIADSDVEERIELLLTRHLRPAEKRARGLRHSTAQRVLRAADQIHRSSTLDGTAEVLARAQMRAFPDRVAARVAGARGESITLQLANGRRAQLSDGSVARDAEFLVALDAEMRRGSPRVHLAAAIDPEWLMEDFADEIVPEEEYIVESSRVFVIEGLRFGALWLTKDRRPASPGSRTAEALFEAARKKGARAFRPESEIDGALGRYNFLASAGLSPPVEPLTDDIEIQILRAMCDNACSFADLETSNFADALFARLPSQHWGQLHRLAPPALTLASGRSLAIHYQRGRDPWVESFLQDFFGMTETPKLAGQPITVHLLAPNKRAVQVTTDLEGFWERHYPTLRSSLLRRYPRHNWPEEPLQAQAMLLKSGRR